MKKKGSIVHTTFNLRGFCVSRVNACHNAYTLLNCLLTTGLLNTQGDPGGTHVPRIEREPRAVCHLASLTSASSSTHASNWWRPPPHHRVRLVYDTPHAAANSWPWSCTPQIEIQQSRDSSSTLWLYLSPYPTLAGRPETAQQRRSQSAAQARAAQRRSRAVCGAAAATHSHVGGPVLVVRAGSVLAGNRGSRAGRPLPLPRGDTPMLCEDTPV